MTEPDFEDWSVLFDGINETVIATPWYLEGKVIPRLGDQSGPFRIRQLLVDDDGQLVLDALPVDAVLDEDLLYNKELYIC